MRLPTFFLVLCVGSSSFAGDDPWLQQLERRREDDDRRRRDEDFARQQQASMAAIGSTARLVNDRVNAAIAESRGSPAAPGSLPGKAGLWHEGLSPKRVAILEQLIRKGHRITGIATGLSSNAFVVTFDHNGSYTENTPRELNEALKAANTNREEIHSLTLGLVRGWVFLRGANGYWQGDLTPEVAALLEATHKEALYLNTVTLLQDGIFLTLNRNEHRSLRAPEALNVEANMFYRSNDLIRSVSVTPRGQWIAPITWWSINSGQDLPPKLQRLLRSFGDDRRDLTAVTLMANGGWVVVSQ